MAVSMLFAPFFLVVITLASAGLLRNIQNSGFESPPTNISANATLPYLLIPKANTIPGWSFNGTVWYVTSGPNISLPGDGHAIQLGQNGKINQTLKVNGAWNELVLTFTLAPADANCADVSTAVNISAAGRSKVFFLERGYGREKWQSHGFNLGIWSETENSINLEFQSLRVDALQNFTCWPLVDTIIVRAFHTPYYSDNLLGNGGFEIGPSFLQNSSEGILLDEDPLSGYENYYNTRSSLQEWSISGTVKYIDSEHYAVPYGKAAIELVSGAVEINQGFQKGEKYTLDFVMGDANNSCLGDFVVYARVGMEIWNFTMSSYGNGSTQKHTMIFKAKTSDMTPLSLSSYNRTQTSDHIFCGPVIDRVVLWYSSSFKLHQGVAISCLVVILAILWI